MLENTSSLSNIGSSVNIRYKKLSDALSLINASIQSLEELVFADLRSPIINVFLSLTFKTANEFVLEYFQEPSLSSQGFNNTRQDSKSRSTTADTVQTPVSPELTLEAALERFKIIYEKGQDVTTVEIQEFSSIFNILKTLPNEQLLQLISELRVLKVKKPWNSSFLSMQTLHLMLTEKTKI